MNKGPRRIFYIFNFSQWPLIGLNRFFIYMHDAFKYLCVLSGKLYPSSLLKCIHVAKHFFTDRVYKITRIECEKYHGSSLGSITDRENPSAFKSCVCVCVCVQPRKHQETDRLKKASRVDPSEKYLGRRTSKNL